MLVDAGVDSELAVRVASGEISAALLDIAEVAANCGRSSNWSPSVYFALGTLLNYGWIAERANVAACADALGHARACRLRWQNWRGSSAR